MIYMSTKFYRYVYGRQNYARYNRYLMLANDCTPEGRLAFYRLQLIEWKIWEQRYKEDPENVPPPPDPPVPPGGLEPSPEEIIDCKTAYNNLVKKQNLNPNSNKMSANMRNGYYLRHQNRLPLLTAWY